MNKKITYEECMSVAKKYDSKSDFRNNDYNMYIAAWRHKWLTDFKWLSSTNIHSDEVDSVYCYMFNELKAVYVGRTLMRRIKIRDWQHRNSEFNGKKVKPDSVNRFASENNVDLPQMTILEENLTIKEGQERESFWVDYYIKQGFHVINIAKAGSLGTLNKGKWNYKNCYNEAKKFTNKMDFVKQSNGAYDSARRHGWLDDYTWFVKSNLKWTRDACYEEAKKYTSRLKFSLGNQNAYDSARRHGWLDDYTWFSSNKKWNYDTCYEEAKKYKTKVDFKHNSCGAYSVSCKNKWIDDYTWFVSGLIKWNYDTCYEEAKKYTCRGEFQKGNGSAYQVALANKWMDKYDWFKKKHKEWNYDTCYEEAKKYTCRHDFLKNNQYAYKISRINNWLSDYRWFKE